MSNMPQIHPYGLKAGGVMVKFQVLKQRRWMDVHVGGLNHKHARERAIEIFGWSPVIRLNDSKEVIWRRKPEGRRVASTLKERMTMARKDRKSVRSESDARTVNNVMRHEYRVLSENEKVDMRAVKDAGLGFFRHIETLETRRGPTRELSLAKTKIEEAVMWAVKHITG